MNNHGIFSATLELSHSDFGQDINLETLKRMRFKAWSTGYRIEDSVFRLNTATYIKLKSEFMNNSDNATAHHPVFEHYLGVAFEIEDSLPPDSVTLLID